MADVMPPPVRPSRSLVQEDIKPRMRSADSHGSHMSRRPPRKSTLTQQQRNQKRQRATQDQLVTLEMEFEKNPTPTAIVRERIAQEINMTERSVQIWFQNRRAKIKNLAKRSIESGEDCDNIPESMRQYLANQAYGPGKGLGAGLLGRSAAGYGPLGMLNPELAGGKVVIQHFSCRCLSIGSWRRVGQSTMDLVIFYSPDKACITYYINNENHGYKIEFMFAWIKNISLEQGEVMTAAEGASQRMGELIIELTRPPKFYMDNSGTGGFYECGDFTEDQQASHVLVHHLSGPSNVLSGQLAKLVSLESYQNRHVLEPAPVPFSETPMRPASQPNHMVNPNLFPEPAEMVMQPPPRGHKRQRSLSVPAAIDLSLIRNPMPTFLIHPEHPESQQMQPVQPVQSVMPDPTIFAPIPQHGAFGLSIDTSVGYNFSHLYNGPISATTVNSPSEFGTPAFMTSVPMDEALSANFHTPLPHDPYLHVDPSVMLGTSATPISVTSHGPMIADYSPPLGASHQTPDLDTPDRSHFGDESIYLPLSERATYHSPVAAGPFDFQSPPSNTSQPVMMDHLDLSATAPVTTSSQPNGEAYDLTAGADGTPYSSAPRQNVFDALDWDQRAGMGYSMP
ncbi:hypothetical protein K470DRAFT_280397 [Piedraia hortae CBS 480.64]|uniref:Homeobox domain-containing protein n=1 Tax=Piedraia hortae CBS 480.64 TaxID=1314780 RepID=A0A6A7C6A5_9PEZI|nr:hypothetical protein K470DRAFT_280397 [Piedraia hortae CBS 480.64]